MMTCGTKVEKLELIKTLQSYYIRAVFDSLFSSSTTVSSSSTGTINAFPTNAILRTLYVPLMG